MEGPGGSGLKGVDEKNWECDIIKKQGKGRDP